MSCNTRRMTLNRITPPNHSMSHTYITEKTCKLLSGTRLALSNGEKWKKCKYWTIDVATQKWKSVAERKMWITKSKCTFSWNVQRLNMWQGTYRHFDGSSSGCARAHLFYSTKATLTSLFAENYVKINTHSRPHATYFSSAIWKWNEWHHGCGVDRTIFLYPKKVFQSPFEIH